MEKMVFTEKASVILMTAILLSINLNEINGAFRNAVKHDINWNPDVMEQ